MWVHCFAKKELPVLNKVARISPPPAVQGLLPAFFCVFSGVIDRLYLDIDSFLVSMTCNGLYGSGAVCPVIHPLLAIVLGRLAPLAPGVDWFTLLSRILVALTAWWVGTVLAWCTAPGPKRVFCLVSFCILLFRFPLFNANYTVHCTFFAMAGVATLVLALRRAMPKGSLFWAAFFLCLAILWRPEGAALLVPFLLLDLAVLVLRHALPLAKVKKVLLPALIPPLLLVAFSALLPVVSPQYAAAKAYSDARRAFVDYPSRPWAEVADEVTALGLDENDYNVLSSSILLDPTIADTETLQKLAVIAKQGFSADKLSTLGSGFVEALSTLQLKIFCVLTVFFLAAVFLSGSPRLSKLEALLAVLGSLLIALYYLYSGRLPERLFVSIFLVQFSVLLPLFLDAAPAPRLALQRFWKAAGLISVCCLCLLLVKNRHNYHVTQLAIHAGTADAADTALLPAEDEDTVYVWDSMSLALYMTEHYMMEGKLPSAAFVRQNLAWGEWNTSGQPFYLTLLHRLDLDNPMQSLLTRPHTYLVAQDGQALRIEAWLQEHYTPDAALYQTATVDVYAYGDVPVWQAAE